MLLKDFVFFNESANRVNLSVNVDDNIGLYDQSWSIRVLHGGEQKRSRVVQEIIR